MTNAMLEDQVAKASAEPDAPLVSSSKPGSPLLGWVIVLLTAAVFILDVNTQDYYHVAVLYNVCIVLTVWSWRPRWVLGTTVAAILLRLVAHVMGPKLTVAGPAHIHAFSLNIAADVFNLTVGIAVQMLTGALIWRQVFVQHRLEAEERQTLTQARDLKRALIQAQQATLEAQGAAQGERAARLREVEARRREHKTLQALERVRDLSAALSRAVLPAVPPEIARGRMRLSARYAPAERDIQIGGDFYDLITLDETETRYALVIGDVAGHGVEAAAQTALVTGTLRTCAFEDEDGPASVLARTARTLEGQLESFVSLFYGIYDADAQTLTYACAGHEPPILTVPDGAPPIALDPTGPILGIGIYEFREITIPLRHGSTLVFLTDGLTEVRRDGQEMLDWDGVAQIAARQATRSGDPDCIADGILGEVRAWAGKPHLNDDVALLIARIV